MTLVRWDPLRDLLNIQERVSRFGGINPRDLPSRRKTCWFPAVDILETSDAYIVRAELPGVGKENINIELIGKRLVISGSRVEQSEINSAAYRTVERVEGYFERCLNMPGSIDVDNAKARYVDGLLDLYLPKAQDDSKHCVKIDCTG